MRSHSPTLPIAAAAATSLGAATAQAADPGYATGGYRGSNSQGGEVRLLVKPGKIAAYGQEVKIT
jgi:hypothetical protein